MQKNRVSFEEEKRYHKGATGRDKVLYDEVVRCLNANVSVMDIHRKTGLSRNTIYSIKRENETDKKGKLTTI